MQTTKERFFLKHGMATSVFGVTLLMAIVALVFYQQERASTTAKNQVVHTYAVTGHIQLLFNRIKDVEMAQRGYLISGEDRYRETYRDALKDSLGEDAKNDKLEQHHSINEEVKILRKLTLENPMQQENLVEMDRDIKELQMHWDEIDKTRNGNLALQLEEITRIFNDGTPLINNVRSLISIMMSMENRLLAHRMEADLTSTRENDYVTFGGVGLFYVLMVFYMYVYHRGRARTQKDLIRHTREVESSEQNLRATMEHAPIGMALVSLDGKFMRVNRALCAIVGYTEDELLKSDFQTLTHSEDLAADMELVEKVQKRQMSSYQMEKRYIHKDGHTVWALLGVSLILDVNNQPAHFISQILDISNRKQADLDRGRLMDKLTDSNTELERFAYVASHDMQEPLRMVASFSSLIAEEYHDKLDKDGLEYLGYMISAAKRMQAMVIDLLEYARIGNDTTRFTTVDATRELSHVLENLSGTIRERKAKVITTDLPSFNGNPVQFMRLLQNLIGNGLKYQLDTVVPQVKVGVDDFNHEWRISIADNGIGMEQEYTQKIFEPFKRLHQWQQYQGTGIGLAVCKKIVENHSGRIWATSAPGKGSTFYFTIPKNKEVQT